MSIQRYCDAKAYNYNCKVLNHRRRKLANIGVNVCFIFQMRSLLILIYENIFDKKCGTFPGNSLWAVNHKYKPLQRLPAANNHTLHSKKHRIVSIYIALYRLQVVTSTRSNVPFYSVLDGYNVCELTLTGCG